MSDPFSFYLASTSPRRHELLQQIGVSFLPLEITEPEPRFDAVSEGECASQDQAERFIAELAHWKAQQGHAHLEQLMAQCPSVYRNGPVMGADTMIFHRGHVLGKPHDRYDAECMLRRLSGGMHQAISAVAIVGKSAVGKNGKGRSETGLAHVSVRVSVTEVGFQSLSDYEIERYLHTGEYQGKAGGYAIQGKAAAFITQVKGSYSCVMGLPLWETCQLLHEFSIPFWDEGAA